MWFLPSGQIMMSLASFGAASLVALKYLASEQPAQEAKRVNTFFRNTRLNIRLDEDKYISPSLINHEKQEHGDLFIYGIPSGLSLTDFKKKKEALEHQLKGEVEMWAIDNRLFIKSATENLPQKIDFEHIDPKNEKLAVPVGYSREGFIFNDLSSSGCHMFVGGPTDSGKSVWIRQAITSLLLNYSPNYLNLNLIDLKQGLELSAFADVPHATGFAETEEEVEDLLSMLNRKINERGQILKKSDNTSIYALNMDIPRIVTVIDEFAELSHNKKIMSQVDRVLRLGRASGIHLILATQRPTVDVITGNMKNNLQARIALMTPSQVDSKTILDTGEAANLPPIKGRAIFKKSSKLTEIQIPFLSQEEAKRVIEEEVGKKEKVVPEEVKANAELI